MTSATAPPAIEVARNGSSPAPARMKAIVSATVTACRQRSVAVAQPKRSSPWRGTATRFWIDWRSRPTPASAVPTTIVWS